MGHEVTIGGERLGSGKRMKTYLKNYERSTHDLSYIWRSTMAAGTLVPFMSEVALPGDTFDINLNVDILTHPTIGPLFGSYKIQLDVFQVPLRIYQGALHMNMLNIGMDMSQIKLPQIQLEVETPSYTKPIDNQQINPSCLLSYMGIRGVGAHVGGDVGIIMRRFNAVPIIGYWDIYKNYYANKQEEIGAVIHKDPDAVVIVLVDADVHAVGQDVNLTLNPVLPYAFTQAYLDENSSLEIEATGLTEDVDPGNIYLLIRVAPADPGSFWKANEVFTDWQIFVDADTILANTPTERFRDTTIGFGGIKYDTTNANPNTDTEPKIVTFPLENIDVMRQQILSSNGVGSQVLIQKADTLIPYTLMLEEAILGGSVVYSKQFSQEGLALKTYNSDLFNNWISTEWIDGVDGISAITAVSTAGDSFTIDELNLSKKIYDMLNRIAISGGSYDDWLDAVYTHDRQRGAENPMYLGGLIRNLVFQEVISNSQSENQPLGTLAGRGTLGNKKKGGQITAKIDEPSYLIGIISLTPNIDYSQGNKWDVNLKTMNDLHKPALDEIGFQDLVTDQMAWFDTKIDPTIGDGLVIYKSAGKQPAWINYMTNVNVVRGNFADQTQQMFMVLNRRYKASFADGDFAPAIADLTTYIDPTKFNHIFADTRLDAQNFWAQVGVNMEVRRKISAKVIPNL